MGEGRWMAGRLLLYFIIMYAASFALLQVKG